MYYNKCVKGFLKDIRFILYAVFAVAEAAIYIAFMVIDNTTGQSTVALRYAGILLCLAVSCAGIALYGKDGVFLTAAMFFTAVADLFMFVLDDFYEISVCSFIVVQAAYFARIYLTSGNRQYMYMSLTARGAIIVAVIIILAVTDSLLPLTALVAIYFPMLVCNALDSLQLVKISKKYWLFFVGLVLFIGCDICVGLYNFSMVGIELSPAAQNFVGAGMWAFYAPSQAFIALSVRKAEYKNIFREFSGNEG